MHAPPEQRRLERLTRIGGALFAMGALATVATVVPYFTGGERWPTVAYLIAMLMPVGFALVLVGLVATARTRSRRARERDPSQG